MKSLSTQERRSAGDLETPGVSSNTSTTEEVGVRGPARPIGDGYERHTAQENSHGSPDTIEIVRVCMYVFARSCKNCISFDLQKPLHYLTLLLI